MTLRQGNREYYYQKLDEHFPQTKQKYINAYGDKYMCTSRKAKKLWDLFVTLCDRYELIYDMKTIIRAYKRGYEYPQLELWD